jgi:D-3-phosphoglycerate dehydrogenase
MLTRQIVALANTSARRSTKLVQRSFSSIEVERIEVEHGRGQWKTYGDVSNYTPGKYQIKTFNKISPLGLARFPTDKYEIRTDKQEARNAHAIMMRSHKLQENEVPHTVRAIAR